MIGRLGRPGAWGALLLVASACGEDGPRHAASDKVPDAAERDSDEDPAQEEETTDDPEAAAPGADAGAHQQSETDGGAAPALTNDAGGVSPEAGPPRADVDTAAERFTSVATDFCKAAFACDATMGRRVWGNEAFCRREVEQLWGDDLELNGADCADAELDLHHCYAAASCADQLTACATEEDDVARLCPSI